MEIQNDLAAYCLMEVHNRTHRNRRMRVAFLVQEIFLWDKQSDIYDVFAKDSDVDVMIVVMPSYNAVDAQAEKTLGRYDPQIWNYFHGRYDHVYAFTNLLSLRVLRPDYVFLDRPYEPLRRMEGLYTADIARFAKICYVSYGTQGERFYIYAETKNTDCFSYISYHFCDSDEEQRILSDAYSLAVRVGVQHFEMLGYPGFQPYLSAGGGRNPIRRVLWTPRWSLDERIGGSHFFDYQDAFIEFAQQHQGSDLQFAVRPHPLMFSHFVRNGYMTEAEVADYKRRLKDSGIEFDEGEEPLFEALTRTDILLSDFSSIVMNFFLLDRPLIYCPTGHTLTEDYARMQACSYVAADWGQIERALTMLIAGEDPEAPQRRRFIEEMRLRHDGAAARIASYLKAEYQKERTPIYSPEVETAIFERKKEVLSWLLHDMRGGALSWADYFAVMPLRLSNSALREEAEMILAQLVETRQTAGGEKLRGVISLAMLLFADPMALPIPIEVDTWPEELYADVKKCIENYRRDHDRAWT